MPRCLALFLTFLLICSINFSLSVSKHNDATNNSSLVRIRIRVNGETYVYHVGRRDSNNGEDGTIVFRFRGVIQEPSFHRESGVWPVILNGSQLSDLVGLSYGNIRVLYFNGTSQEWVEVPYQIDERGYSHEIVDYDDTPTYDWVFTYIRWGAQELGPGGVADPNQMQKRLDYDDELVFYTYNGSRVDESTWWNTSYPYRIELTIIDPVDNGRCWMYIYFRNDTTIITGNPYENTELDFIDWFPSNLTAKSQYYSASLNSSNPDLTSFMKQTGGEDIIREGNKQWLCVNGTTLFGKFSKDCNREGTWDTYYTEMKSNVGFLNGNDIRQENVGNGSAISDGPVRVIVNISHYIEVSISVGPITVTETEVKRDILFFYSKFRGSPYKVRIKDNPDVENEMVKYVFAGILSFSPQALGTQIYYGNYTQGGYYGVDIVSGTGTDDYHTSGGDPWTPDLDPIRNNDDIPEWIIFNNSDMVEFFFPPYKLLLQVKENASGVYTYWKDEATVSEFGPVIEALTIPVNTITVFVADLIVKPQPTTSDSEVNNIGQKFFQYFNHTEISLVDEETMISDVSFLEFQYQVQPAPQDTTLPNVTIDEPANNSVVGGIVTIQVTSSDENPDTTWLTIDGNTVATWISAGTYTYDWDTTSESDGEHQIIAYANDTAGNVGSYSITVVVDNSPPSVTIDQPQNESYVKGTVTIQVTSNDAYPNSTWLEIDGNIVDSWSGSGTFTYSWDTTSDGDGIHQIIAHANDSVGNIANYSIVVIVDNTPPSISITNPQNNSLVSGTVNIQVNSSDQNPNTTWLEINGTVVQTWSGEGTFTYPWDTTNHPDGVYEIVAYANDSAGNMKSYKIYVEVDNTPPSVTIDFPANNSIVSGVVDVIVTSNDPHSDTTWLTINGTVVQTWSGAGAFTYSWDTTTYVDGYYELIAYANDTLGNINSYRIITQVSNQGLAVSITNPQNNSVVGGIVSIEVSSSNAEATWLEIDGNTVQYWSGSGMFTYSWNTTSVSDGSHKIVAYANNTFGHQANYSVTVVVDNTPPDVLISSPRNNSIVHSTITIELSSNDLHPDKTWLTIDGVVIGPWSGSGDFTYDWDTTTVSDGQHIIVAYANDTVGNIGSYDIVVTVDNTPPSITITSPSNDSTVGTTFDVTWDASDTTTDIEKVEVYLNGTLDAVYVIGVNMTNTHTFSGLEPNRDYIVNITVYDGAGWSSYDWILVHTSGFFISITSPNDGDAFNKSWVLVEWEYGELDTVKIYLNGSLVDVVPADTRSYNITNLNEGTWNITLVGLNTSTIPTRQASNMVIIYIDWTPPYVNILRPTDGKLLNTSDVYIEWEGCDWLGNVTTDIDHYEVRWDKSSWIDVDLSTSYMVPLSDGNHTIYVKAVDRAGNIAIDQVTITVDTTPPSVSIVSPNNGSYIYSSKIVVSWSAYDANGIDHFELYVDGDPVDLNIPPDKTNYTITVSEGEHTVCIIAIDRAGNSASCSVSFTVRIHRFPSYFVIPIVALIITTAVVLLRKKRK